MKKDRQANRQAFCRFDILLLRPCGGRFHPDRLRPGRPHGLHLQHGPSDRRAEGLRRRIQLQGVQLRLPVLRPGQPFGGVRYRLEEFQRAPVGRVQAGNDHRHRHADSVCHRLPHYGDGVSYLYTGEAGGLRLYGGLQTGLYYVLKRLEFGVYSFYEDYFQFGVIPEAGVLLPVARMKLIANVK